LARLRSVQIRFNPFNRLTNCYGWPERLSAKDRLQRAVVSPRKP